MARVLTDRLRRNRVTLAAGLAAALPVIVATIRALNDGWMPAGDQGIVATHAYDVFTSHTPLLGQFSQASRVVNHPLYSPGPMLYWLLVGPAHVGAPASLTLTMGALNSAAIVGTVALARRRGGLLLMFAVALAVAAMSRSISPENMHALFNPAAGIFPFLLLVFVCWSIACGEYRLLPLAVLTASFVVQCHLAFVLPTAAVLLVGVSGLVAGRGRLRGRARPWLIAAAVTAAICWTLPVVDQAIHSPGNLGLIATAATSREQTEGATPAWRATVRVVGAPPRWLRPPASDARHLGAVSGGDYGDTRLADLWSAPSVPSAASAILLLSALIAAMVAGLRRGRRDIAAAAAIGLLLCVAFAVMVARTPSYAVNALGYTMWWGSVAGMWAWLIALWSAVELLGVRRRLERVRVPAFASVAGVGAVVLVGAGVALAEGRDSHAPFYRPIRAIVADLDAALPRGRTVRLVQRGSVVVPIEPAIRYALRRHGVRALGRGSVRPGSWYELHNRRYDALVSVFAGATPASTPAIVVGRAVVTDSRGPHPIGAAVSPPGARMFAHVR